MEFTVDPIDRRAHNPWAMRTKEAILQELVTEQAKLDELERELSRARAKIDTLRADLHTAAAAKPSALPPSKQGLPASLPHAAL